MFSETAALYDVVYSAFKDYAEEARRIAVLLRQLHPHARTLLDVGCGTGEHARLLHEVHGYEVDGLDLDARMVEIAAAKNPAGRFAVADMADFDLGRRYDVVLSLFSSIGYVRTMENLILTLRRCRRHLDAGGILVVEPWFEPGVLEPGRVHVHTAEASGLKVCRMSRTTIQGRVSRLEFEYLVGESAGIRRASEIHELGLFTAEETRAAFEKAGFAVEHDEAGIGGRGLFVGRVAGELPQGDG